MRRRTTITAAGSAICTLAVGGSLLVGGIVTGTTIAAPPAAGARALNPFKDCQQLRQWYIDRTIREVGPYGWNYGPIGFAGQGDLRMSEKSAAAVPLASVTKDRAAQPSNTGTNVQEAGVDEPDTAKTNGHLIARLVEGRRVVLTDVTGQPTNLGSWTLPKNVWADGLLLIGDHVVLVGNTDVGGVALGSPLGSPLGTVTDDRMTAPSAAGSRIIDLDISDPTAPTVVQDTTISGGQISLQSQGNVVRLVTTTGLPMLKFVNRGNDLGNQASDRRATERNRDIVRRSTVSDWIPSVTDNRTGETHPLVKCSDVLHPTRYAGSDTIAVTGWDVTAPQTRSTVAVTASGQNVYSSTDRLYVAAEEQHLMRPMMANTIGRFMPPKPLGTDLHAFRLDGIGATYLASGHINASVRDRWSMDSYDGRLRLAVSWQGRNWQIRDNGIVILAEKGPNLVQVGQVRGLGKKENLQSVRFFDDLALVVTFRQMDPLYTVDLSDPTHPSVKGALKIPGFSSYLHPIGDHQILGIGTAATAQGRSLGAQASVFDVADLTRPRQVSKVGFGRDTYSSVGEDPHAFTWLADRHAALISVDDWRKGGSSLHLLTVGAGGSLTDKSLGEPSEYGNRTLELPGGRVALVGSTVRLLDLS